MKLWFKPKADTILRNFVSSLLLATFVHSKLLNGREESCKHLMKYFIVSYQSQLYYIHQIHSETRHISLYVPKRVPSILLGVAGTIPGAECLHYAVTTITLLLARLQRGTVYGPAKATCNPVLLYAHVGPVQLCRPTATDRAGQRSAPAVGRSGRCRSECHLSIRSCSYCKSVPLAASFALQ